MAVFRSRFLRPSSRSRAAPAAYGEGHGTITPVDARTGAAQPALTVRRDDEDDVWAPPTPSAIAAGRDGAWVNHVRGQLLHLGARPAARPRRLRLGGASFADGLAFAAGSLWVTSSATDHLLQVDPTCAAVVSRIALAAAAHRTVGPNGIAAGDGAIWVADTLADTVTRVDPRLGAVTATIRVGRRPTRLAVAADAVWALNAGDGTVSRIDPRSNTTVATVRVGAHATDLTVAGGLVWVSAAGGTAKAGRAPVPSVLQPLPASSCSPVMTAPRQTPRRLIAVSLPLRLSGGLAARMTAAIGRVIQAARYRAGRFAIGYQVSTTPSATSPDGTPPAAQPTLKPMRVTAA